MKFVRNTIGGLSNFRIVTAVCFFCDVVENGGDDIFSMTAEKAAEKFLECMKNFPSDRGLIQSAGYGLGAIAKRAPRGQFAYLGSALKFFKVLLDDPECRTDDDKAESTDNIIGALGKCILFQYDGQLIGLPAVREYLNLLPLYSDSEEAQTVHKLLFEQILVPSPVLSIPELAKDVTQCVQRIVRIAQDKPDLELLDDEGKEKAQLVVSRLQSQ